MDFIKNTKSYAQAVTDNMIFHPGKNVCQKLFEKKKQQKKSDREAEGFHSIPLGSNNVLLLQTFPKYLTMGPIKLQFPTRCLHYNSYDVQIY